MNKKIWSYDEALQASLNYFNNDELAAKVFVDKYALRDNENNLLEKSPEEMHRRIAKEFARVEKNKFKNPLSEDEIFSYLDRFKYIVPQGSPMFGIGNKYQYVSLSNCFFCENLKDSYSSILMIDEQIVQISKRRGGAGVDISALRPEGAMTQNAAKSSTGIIPFMERFSNSVREVGQNNRRGALMISISVHHPEILNFIRVKKDLTKITGANISVRVTDEFMKAVDKDKEFELRWPVDAREKGQEPKISKMVKAKDIWKEIVEGAWKASEPGVLFWDNITKYTPADCYEKYASKGTNPCCFSKKEEVFVLTKEGPKEIKSITYRDLIWVDEIKGWSETNGYFDAGIAEIYKVTFANEVKLFITKNHKLCNEKNKLVKLEDLKIGDKILVQYGKEKYTTIENIEYVETGEVGCIEVEKYHKFTANGIISGNSELNLAPLDSCRLLLLNLFSYVKNPFAQNSEFDYDLFYKHSQIAQRLMDDLVDLEEEKVKEILKKIDSDPEDEEIKAREKSLWQKILNMCKSGRRTGTGATGLADAFAALGIEYASDKSLKVADKIFKTLKLGCYRSSVDMAKEIGTFEGFDFNKEKNNEFLLRIKDEDIELYNDMKKYGRRNVALLTMSPAGSVSLETQTTSGIEPLFKITYKRRKKINPNAENAKVDFVDPSGDKWQEFEVYHPKLKTWMEISKNNDINKSPWHKCCSEDLNWENRVKLQSVIQKHICHSLSSTLNLPEHISKEKVSDIYKSAWEHGLKGVTVYRQNSRTGVLIDSETNKPQEKITKTHAPKRPKSLPCDIHHIKVTKRLDKARTFEYVALVGLLNNEPYEIFAFENGFIDKKYTKGIITKEKRGHYSLNFEDGKKIENICKDITQEEDGITRLISTSLRHGADINFIVHQLEKVRDGEIGGFLRSLARSLKKHIKEGARVSGDDCPECVKKGISGTLLRINGCIQCSQCGWSKCS